MTEQNQTRVLLAMLRDALHQLAGTLERTQEDIDAISHAAARLREGLAALGALRREDASVGIDMVIDAAVALLQAFHDLELALPDAQADVETLEAEREADEDGRDL